MKIKQKAVICGLSLLKKIEKTLCLKIESFEDEKKIFAVATLEAGDLIESSRNWFFKGAFSTTPVIFQVKRTYQIDALHGFVSLNAFNNFNNFAEKNVNQFPIR